MPKNKCIDVCNGPGRTTHMYACYDENGQFAGGHKKGKCIDGKPINPTIK